MSFIEEILSENPNLTRDQVIQAMDILLDGSHWVELNMNDTFGFACADSERMYIHDFSEIIPTIVRWGHKALIAYAAVKRGQEPITCKCRHNKDGYEEAKSEILAEKNRNEYFMDE